MADRLDAPDSSRAPDWSKPAEVGAKLLADTHGLEKGFNSPQFKQDLATANQWLHEHNFPNLNITGVDDKGRLITVDTDSHHFVLLADGAKPTDIGTGSDKFEKTDSGHQAKLNPDGSGIYKVADTDKSGWDLAKSILQDRGVQYPSATQIANFENQLLQANGIPQKDGEAWFKHLRAGQEIKVPALEGEGTAPVRASEAPPEASSSLPPIKGALDMRGPGAGADEPNQNWLHPPDSTGNTGTTQISNPSGWGTTDVSEKVRTGADGTVTHETEYHNNSIIWGEPYGEKMKVIGADGKPHEMDVTNVTTTYDPKTGQFTAAYTAKDPEHSGQSIIVTQIRDRNGNLLTVNEKHPKPKVPSTDGSYIPYIPF